MITIRYRPLANRRTYESVCLPIDVYPYVRLSPTEIERIVPAPRPEFSGMSAARFKAWMERHRPDDKSSPEKIAWHWRRLTGSTVDLDQHLTLAPPDAFARPDPIGRAIAEHKPRDDRPTREIVIPCEATLPAIAARLDSLEKGLRADGQPQLAEQVRAVAAAVGTCITRLVDTGDGGAPERTDALLAAVAEIMGDAE